MNILWISIVILIILGCIGDGGDDRLLVDED